MVCQLGLIKTIKLLIGIFLLLPVSSVLASQIIVEPDLETSVETATFEASSEVNPTTSPAPEVVERNSKQIIYESAVDFANVIDQFFGESEELESASYDFLRLVNTLGWREGEGFEFNPRIRAKVHFPKINKKWSLLFSGDTDEELEQLNDPPSDTLFENRDDERTTSAALNYESDQYDRSKFDTRIGIDSHFDAFVSLKHTFRIYEDESNYFRNYNYLFWRDDEGFGANVKFEYDRVLESKNLFRWKYSILESEKSQGKEWRNTFSYVKPFSEETWVSYDFGINGATEQSYEVETYRLAVRYRHQLNIEWLYIEVEPELRWHREPEWDSRELVTGIILRFEIQFEE